MDHFCPPGSGSGFHGLIESGSSPDPKHCLTRFVPVGRERGRGRGAERGQTGPDHAQRQEKTQVSSIICCISCLFEWIERFINVLTAQCWGSGSAGSACF
jgi:hypothetical protein